MNEQEDMKEKKTIFIIYCHERGCKRREKKILFIALFVVNITINENENEKKQNLLLFRERTVMKAELASARRTFKLQQFCECFRKDFVFR